MLYKVGVRGPWVRGQEADGAALDVLCCDHPSEEVTFARAWTGVKEHAL